MVPESAALTVYRIGMQLYKIVLIVWIPCRMKSGEILEKLSCCVASQDQHYSIELVSRKATVIQSDPAGDLALGH
jgi:hypothetical protein